MKRSPIKRQSVKRRRQAKARAECRRIVIERAGGMCEMPWLSIYCTEKGEHVHEKRTRAQGGSPTDPSNCLYVCAQCHDFIHRFPRAAAAAGAIVMRKTEAA